MRTLVNEAAGALAYVLQIRDLAVQLRDLRGELVDLPDILLDALVEVGALRGQIVGRDIEGAGQVVGRGEHALAQ